MSFLVMLVTTNNLLPLIEFIDHVQSFHGLLHREQLRIIGDGKIEQTFGVGQLLSVGFELVALEREVLHQHQTCESLTEMCVCECVSVCVSYEAILITIMIVSRLKVMYRSWILPRKQIYFHNILIMIIRVSSRTLCCEILY